MSGPEMTPVPHGAVDCDYGEWTDRTLLALEILWERGYSINAIGAYIGKTKNAVVGKAHRMGLPSRQSPIIRGGNTAPPRPRVPRQTLPPLPSVAAEPKTVPTAVVLPMAAPPPLRAPTPAFRAPAPLRPVRPVFANRECQWIEGDPRDGKFCCKPVVVRFGAEMGTLVPSSWCNEHFHRVFSRSRVIPVERLAMERLPPGRPSLNAGGAR